MLFMKITNPSGTAFGDAAANSITYHSMNADTVGVRTNMQNRITHATFTFGGTSVGTLTAVPATVTVEVGELTHSGRFVAHLSSKSDR